MVVVDLFMYYLKTEEETAGPRRVSQLRDACSTIKLDEKSMYFFKSMFTVSIGNYDCDSLIACLTYEVALISRTISK